MSDRIAMETDEALVEIVPRLGGSIAAFDVKRGKEWVPILRRWTGESENPRALVLKPHGAVVQPHLRRRLHLRRQVLSDRAERPA